jgi:uncharacterized protein
MTTLSTRYHWFSILARSSANPQQRACFGSFHFHAVMMRSENRIPPKSLLKTQRNSSSYRGGEAATKEALYNLAVNLLLDEVETRVLGALVEKDITTPDYYPLSLNALVNACNQKNNREPVMNLDEDVVRQALDALHAKNLVGPASGADSRVTKYEHRLQEAFNFNRGETAILCVLLLRGPQTPGELRGRTERMQRFEALDEVQSTLQRLMQRQPPLVKVLLRQPGTKEARYMHLLSGDLEDVSVARAPSPAIANNPVDTKRLALLEDEVQELRKEVANLKQQLASFRKEFE